MTRQSILEYAATLRPRYQLAGKREKGALLDAFCRLTGYHQGRDSAVGPEPCPCSGCTAWPSTAV
jgi:hypothetical protein